VRNFRLRADHENRLAGTQSRRRFEAPGRLPGSWCLAKRGAAEDEYVTGAQLEVGVGASEVGHPVATGRVTGPQSTPSVARLYRYGSLAVRATRSAPTSRDSACRRGPSEGLARPVDDRLRPCPARDLVVLLDDRAHVVRAVSSDRRDLVVVEARASEDPLGAINAPILALLTVGDEQGQDAAQSGLRFEAGNVVGVR
jgi:hypothetical protein